MNEKKFEELLLKNNKYLVQEMDTREKRLEESMDKKILESERRQNQKLAKLEYDYGEKISTIFDKVISIDEKLSQALAISIKNENKLEQHADKLFMYDHRISKLEEQVYSK